MFMPYFMHKATKPASRRNWEANIASVSIEVCPEQEDPLGYRAVFHLEEHKEGEAPQKTFVIGGSFLAQRKQNLEKAGYSAPMTNQAIEMLKGCTEGKSADSGDFVGVPG